MLVVANNRGDCLMRLHKLLEGTEVNPDNVPDLDIEGITSDSRKVGKGFLFAALKGVTFDGQKFIPQAIEKGALVIVADTDAPDYPEVCCLKVKNPHWLFAKIAANFYQRQPAHIAAVTGTNGKTSIADFTRQVLNMMGKKAASLGTLGLIKNNEEPQYAMTTPDPVTIQQTLQKLCDDGYEYVAMEASSHGLCQYRIGGVKVEVAAFTNLTRDHLDYHKTMENYLAAKTILFTDILEVGGSAVLNADSDVFDHLKEACVETGKKVVSYGHNGTEIKLIKATPSTHGQKIDAEYLGKRVEFDIPLAGEFQAMNVLCALGILAEITKQPWEVLKYISKIHGAKGRLELVRKFDNQAAVYVDYAHTPDALENVLKAMRPHCDNHLKVLFGCGGDRDKGKRPIMGQIADKLADKIYVTDDNPRSEEPEQIRSEIMAACPRGINIADRRKAIKQAVAELEAGDILIVAGKGHETGQIIKGETLPFCDQDEILNA